MALKGDNCTTFATGENVYGEYAPRVTTVPITARSSILAGGGIIREAQTRMDAVGGRAYGADNKRFTTWRAIKRVAEGAKILTEHYAELVAAQAKKARGNRKWSFIKWRTA